jgi:uncharacterized DUF497 family protein
MLFEWDEAKDQANIQKHGVSFETAKRIFDGPVLTWRDNRRDYGEDCDISIGQVSTALIVVAHTDRAGRIRLISARPASRKERQAYHEQIR